jgi:large subunit ribosomal protein L9
MGGDMRVILLQDVSGLGTAGEVKEVADGYGRNFLIPKRLAEFASPALLKRVEEQRQAIVRRRDMAETELITLADTLDGAEVVVKAKVGAQGRLYGAVTSSDIAEGIHRVIGQEIDKRKIELEEPIHQLGEYQVMVRLSKELVPSIKVVVEGENG